MPTYNTYVVDKSGHTFHVISSEKSKVEEVVKDFVKRGGRQRTNIGEAVGNIIIDEFGI